MARATCTFFHGQRLIKRGDVLPLDDAAVVAAPAYFDVAPGVESASAAPGEKRAIKRAAKRVAKAV